MAGLPLLRILPIRDGAVGWVALPGPWCLCILWLPPSKVMKRVRTEQIQMAVSCYLKRRQYVDSDGPLKQGLRLSQTAEEMAANLTGNGGGLSGGVNLEQENSRQYPCRIASLLKTVPERADWPKTSVSYVKWMMLASETLSVIQSHTHMPPLITSVVLLAKVISFLRTIQLLCLYLKVCATFSFRKQLTYKTLRDRVSLCPLLAQVPSPPAWSFTCGSQVCWMN